MYAYLHKLKPLKPLVVKVLFRSWPNKNILNEKRVLLLAATRSRPKWSCGQTQYCHSYESSLHLATAATSALHVDGRQVPCSKSSASLHVLPASLSGSFLFLSEAFSVTSCVSWIPLLTAPPLISNYHPHRSADRAVHSSTSKHF